MHPCCKHLNAFVYLYGTSTVLVPYVSVRIQILVEDFPKDAIKALNGIGRSNNRMPFYDLKVSLPYTYRVNRILVL